MKCEECGGTGKVQKWFYERTGFGKCEKVCGDVKCEWCNGTGEVEQTNEEWFCQLSTEEKAEELLAWWFDGANTYSQFGLFKWEIDEAKEKIMKWLKQPHTPKE